MSGVAHHVWPKPLFRDGKVYDAPNQKEYNAHMQSGPSDNSNEEEPVNGYGWSPTYKHQEFPKALHGKNAQGEDISISVANEREMKMGLKNGWTLKPKHAAPKPEEVRIYSFNAPPPAPEGDSQGAA